MSPITGLNHQGLPTERTESVDKVGDGRWKIASSSFAKKRDVRLVYFVLLDPVLINAMFVSYPIRDML